MSGFVTQPIGNAALAAPGENAPTAMYPASVWDSQDWFGGTRQLARAAGGAAAQFGTFDEYGRQLSAPEPDVDPQELNRKWGIEGQLRFDNPLPESVAIARHDAKRDELMRADAASRSDAGMLTRFSAGLVSGAADPLNIAATFLPVVPEARVMGMLAKAGIDGAGGRLLAHALTGGAGALTAQVPLTALRYGLSQQEGADYSASDAAADIVMGTLLGGGLHTAMGGIHDLVGGRFAKSAVAAQVEDSPAVREAAMRAAVAQVAQGEAVNIAPVLDTTARRSAYADRLAARGDTGAGAYASYTPQGLRVELRPEVVELADLIASHDDSGAVNPAFPHEEGMQPRDGSSAASQAQIQEIASRLEPERLGPSPEASTGAPIVNGDNVVESGNGRVMALRRVYGDPALGAQADAYKSFLAARGHDIDGMKQPVLIGRRVTDLSADETRGFVRGANERSTLGMNAAEQARADASRAGKAIGAYVPGPLAGSGNRGFIGAFMAQVPAEERGGMVLGNGQLSVQGETRIRQALLAHAYGDALGPTLERMLNGDTDHMKGVAGALADAAGAWSQMRVAAGSGEIPAGLDITPAIGEAVQLLDRARSAKMPLPELLAQGDMVGGPSPAAAGLLRLMFRDEAMRQPVARAKLAELLDGYVAQAMEAKPGPGLFGEPETAPGDVLRAVGSGDARAEAAATGLETAAEELSPRAAHGAADSLNPAPEELAPGAPPETAERPGAAPGGTEGKGQGGLFRETPAPEARDAPGSRVPPEIAEQIAGLQRTLADALAADRADASVAAELAEIDAKEAASNGVIDGLQQAASCLLGGIGP